MEAIDLELDRLISKRASQDRRPDPDVQSESWKASVRRYNTRRQEENRLAWREHHERQAACLRATLEDLIAHHQARAAQLMDTQPQGES